MNKRKEKLEGQIFNYLFVKEYIGNDRYLCECLNCGNDTIATTARLKSGRKKSCGCLRFQLVSDAIKTHGDSHSRLYREFHGMHVRCYSDKSNMARRIYQDRDITVCDEWLHNYPAFKEWAINNGYNDNLTLDRIDNNRGYSPDNCRWATQLEQASNKRTNIYITIDGVTHTMAEWCRINGISYTAARKRTRERGWDPIAAVTTPTRIYNKKYLNSSKQITNIQPAYSKGPNGYEISYNGQTLNARQWSDITGLPAHAIIWRLKHNWTIERTLSEPIRTWEKDTFVKKVDGT